tara:strand:+ start:590 stop:1573 length:984 start_codon:yes stop_codon:yes gene_type:complete
MTNSGMWYPKEKPLLSMSGLWGGIARPIKMGAAGTVYGIELYGAGGGAGAGSYMGSGGSGGYTKLTIELTPGTYYATAGQEGVHGTDSGHNSTRVGGGGKRAVGTDQGGTGGGFSGIWANNTYSGDPVCMVGGGGGSDWQDQGGNGGGCNVNGGTGWDRIGNIEWEQGNARPIGATLTAGGFYQWTYSSQPGPQVCNGEVGVQLRGGDSTCTDTWAGGGGGGGYWGGGAGTGNIGQGGTPGSGGSGYADPTLNPTIITNTTSAQRLQTFTDATNVYYQPNHPGTYGGGAARNGDGGGGRVKVYDETFTTLLHDFTSGGGANQSFTLS